MILYHKPFPNESSCWHSLGINLCYYSLYLMHSLPKSKVCVTELHVFTHPRKRNVSTTHPLTQQRCVPGHPPPTRDTGADSENSSQENGPSQHQVSKASPQVITLPLINVSIFESQPNDNLRRPTEEKHVQIWMLIRHSMGTLGQLERLWFPKRVFSTARSACKQGQCTSYVPLGSFVDWLKEEGKKQKRRKNGSALLTVIRRRRS